VSQVTLSAEQSLAAHTVLEMEGSGFTYLTGKAGAGKSTVVRFIRQHCKPIMLAPTGIAAVNVGGQTIDSFFGLRPGQSYFRMRDRAKNALRSCSHIFIDEIGMVRADKLDHVDGICRQVMERPGEPFGGIPVLGIGDIWQLEPVVRKDEKEQLERFYDSPFFFDSDAFRRANPTVIELSRTFRQSEGSHFADALNSVREGRTDMLHVFNTRAKTEPSESAIRLCMTNGRADAINWKRLNAIDAEPKTYLGITEGDFKSELPVPKELTLKVGCRVLTTVNNYDYGELIFCNGQTGTVVELRDHDVVVEFDSGDRLVVEPYEFKEIEFGASADGKLEKQTTAKYHQLPLKLAYAATIHKSQGQTYDEAHLELDITSFAHGQTYVALSRIRTLEGLTMPRALMPFDVKVNKRVQEWCAQHFGRAA
jgi:ATP-dependent DNA helicase PIF1